MCATLLAAERFFNRFSDIIGAISAVLLLLLVLNVFYDVIMRYWFNDVSIGMQELEWHLYSMIFLFGVAYSLKADGHVRVDVIYERLSVRGRAIIDILGTVLLLWPFCFLVTDFGIDFAQQAYEIGEKSGDPGGLPHRWIIKSMISASFICVLISSLGFILRAINEFCGLEQPHDYDAFKP
ncbi:TRAP transporter small permease subunit [Thiosocius teredinicola]|uniref:TRAP transporter small permease subunit n=1 Tax=Thiosocius teredinicola TaxID=1973002 RepID=UPI0009910447